MRLTNPHVPAALSRTALIRLSTINHQLPTLLALLSSACLTGVLAQGVATGLSADSGSQPPTVPTLGAAQIQPAPATGSPGIVPGPRLGGTSQLAVPAPVAETTLFSAGEGLLQWGMVHLDPHFLYQLSYGNGLQAQPGQQANTLVNQFSPGVLVQLGPHWSLDYTPTLRFYSDSRFQDGTDHAVSLSFRNSYDDWSFGFSQGYSLSSQPLVETAAQTEQEAYSTALTANYLINSKWSLDLGLNQSFRFLGQNIASQQLSDMKEWSTMDWVNYQVVPGLTAGVGAGFTYDNMSVGPDITSEQYQGRIVWKAGNKLTVSLSGGLDDLQFSGSNTPDLISPTFSLAFQYQLFEATSLSLSASRVVAPSYFQSQVTESTSVSAGVHQRLFKRLSLDVTGGYGTTAYQGTTASPAAAGIGNYDSTSFSVSLSTAFLKRATASIFYQASYNNSGAANFNYDTTQVGLTIGYRF